MESIDHAAHRYTGTCGDWFFAEDGSLDIKVSRLPDNRYEWLIAVHELVEAILCRASGISQESVDAWDRAWEAGDRDAHSRATGEPGDDHRAPYHRQHRTATIVEQLLAHELGVTWSDYEKAIGALG